MRLAVPAAIVFVLILSGCQTPSRQELLDEGMAHFQVDRTEEARAVLERLLSYYPGDPDGLYVLGRVYHKRKEYPQAIYYYRCCIDAAPSYRVARAWLERAEAESGLQGGDFRFQP